MMDIDEFGDDIADEDFLTAFDQVSSSNVGQLASTSSSSGTTKNSRNYEQQQRIAKELEDLPSDAFSSPEPEPVSVLRDGDRGHSLYFQAEIAAVP